MAYGGAQGEEELLEIQAPLRKMGSRQNYEHDR